MEKKFKSANEEFVYHLDELMNECISEECFLELSMFKLRVVMQKENILLLADEFDQLLTKYKHEFIRE